MNPFKIIGIVMIILMLSGCYAHHPYGFNSPAANGAAIGAILGGTAGYLIDNSYSDRDYYRDRRPRRGPRYRDRDYRGYGNGYGRRGRY